MKGCEKCGLEQLTLYKPANVASCDLNAAGQHSGSKANMITNIQKSGNAINFPAVTGLR